MMEIDLEPKYLALFSEAERQELPDLDSLRLCFQAMSLSTLIEREGAALLAPHGLSEGRFVLLSLLEPHKEGLPPHVLADHAGVARATITGLVDGMVRDGMVERHGNPEDRRSNLVRLTRKGRQLARKVFLQQGRWFGGLFASLSANERRQLSKTLSKLSADIRDQVAEA